MKNFQPAKKRVGASVGESLRVMRELQEMSQNDLARLTGIPHSTISAIENERRRLGIDRAKILARALRCHPVCLLFRAGTPSLRTPHDSSVQRLMDTATPALSRAPGAKSP